MVLYRGNGVINTISYSRFGSPERRISGIIPRERSNKYYILFQVWFSGEKDWWDYTEGTEYKCSGSFLTEQFNSEHLKSLNGFLFRDRTNTNIQGYNKYKYSGIQQIQIFRDTTNTNIQG